MHQREGLVVHESEALESPDLVVRVKPEVLRRVGTWGFAVVPRAWRHAVDHHSHASVGQVPVVEREEIALLRAKNLGVRAIARELGRDPSTISRELRRVAATWGGQLEYRASIAQWKAELMAKRPRSAKLAVNDRLREDVQDRLAGVQGGPDGMEVPGTPEAACVEGQEQTPDARRDAGRRPGAGNRSRTSCRSTSPMMSPCGSATKRSIRRSTWRVVAHSNGLFASNRGGPVGVTSA